MLVALVPLWACCLAARDCSTDIVQLQGCRQMSTNNQPEAQTGPLSVKHPYAVTQEINRPYNVLTVATTYLLSLYRHILREVLPVPDASKQQPYA